VQESLSRIHFLREATLPLHHLTGILELDKELAGLSRRSGTRRSGEGVGSSICLGATRPLWDIIGHNLMGISPLSMLASDQNGQSLGRRKRRFVTVTLGAGGGLRLPKENLVRNFIHE
jgi:hypothetical protein